MIKKAVFVFILFSILFPPLFAADSQTFTPAPYKNDEFPQWLHDVRRAEVLLIGSFPLTLFVTNITYGLIRYGENEFDEAYAPSLLGNQNPTPLTEEEKIGVVLTAVGISAAIALTDFIIGRIIEDQENEKE